MTTVLKLIEINLTGPVCSCKSQDLGWSLDFKELTLDIHCKTCATELKVPYRSIKASWRLGVSYPEIVPVLRLIPQASDRNRLVEGP